MTRKCVTTLVGMPGFEVLSTEMVDGDWYVGGETPRDLVSCGECGAVARVKDRRTVRVRDLLAGGDPLVQAGVRVPIRVVREEDLDRAHEAVAPRVVLTDRAQRWVFEQVGYHRPVSSVAGQLGGSRCRVHTPIQNVVRPERERVKP